MDIKHFEYYIIYMDNRRYTDYKAIMIEYVYLKPILYGIVPDYNTNPGMGYIKILDEPTDEWIELLPWMSEIRKIWKINDERY